METPFIFLAGLKILEPATLITDAVLAVSCFFYGYRILKVDQKSLTLNLRAMFFILMGVSSFLGGFAHGFYYWHGDILHGMTRSFACLSILAIEWSSIATLNSQKLKRLLFSGTLLKSLVAIFFITWYHKFFFVIINSASGVLFIVIFIELVHYSKDRLRARLIFILGIFLNVLPAIIHLINLSPSKWFNHNDVSHLVLVLCFYIVMKGAIGIETSSKNVDFENE